MSLLLSGNTKIHKFYSKGVTDLNRRGNNIIKTNIKWLLQNHSRSPASDREGIIFILRHQ